MMYEILLSFHFIGLIFGTPFDFGKFYNTTESSIIEFARRAHSCVKPFSKQKSCCSCADDCNLFGNCCPDKEWINSDKNLKRQLNSQQYINDMIKATSKSNRQALQCEDAFDDITRMGGQISTSQYLMITSCPDGALKSDVKKCADPGLANPLLIDRLPVLGDYKVLYKNRYCASCHRVTDLFYVRHVLDCVNLAPLKRITESCHLSIGKTRGVSMAYRSCNKTIWNKRCPTGHPLTDLCNAYVGVFAGYRNYHCWLCNNGDENKNAKSMKNDVDMNRYTDQCFLNENQPPNDNITRSLMLYFSYENNMVIGSGIMKKKSNNGFTPLFSMKCHKRFSNYIQIPFDKNCKRFTCPHFYKITQNYCKRIDAFVQYKNLIASDEATIIFSHSTSVTSDNLAQRLNLPEHAIQTVIKHHDTSISVMELSYSIFLIRYPSQLSHITAIISPIVNSLILSSVKPLVLKERYLMLYNTFPGRTLCLQSTRNLNSTAKHKMATIFSLSSFKQSIHTSYCIQEITKKNCNVTDIAYISNDIILPKPSEFNYTESMFVCVKKSQKASPFEVIDQVSTVIAWTSFISYLFIFLRFWFCMDSLQINYGTIAVCIFAFLSDFIFSIALSLKVSNILQLDALCPYISALVHFFFLNIYFWCVASLYDAYKSTKKETDKESNDQSSNLKTYLKSKALFIPLPLIIIIIAEILYKYKIFNVSYSSRKLCWIEQVFSQIYLYQIPVVISIISIIPIVCLLISKIQKDKSSQSQHVKGIKTSVKVVLACEIIDLLCFLPIHRDADSIVFLIYVLFKALRGIVLLCFLGDRRILEACVRSGYKVEFQLKYKQNKDEDSDEKKVTPFHENGGLDEIEISDDLNSYA